MNDSEELSTIPVQVTCHTDNCGNSEIGIVLDLYDVDMRVICGVCGNDIEDKIKV